jgi:hypothetical protein
MANSQTEAISKELHAQAANLAREYVNDFSISLLLQAKTIAYQQKADMVMSSHVAEAREILQSEQKKSWSREILMILGSALLGAFIQGFTTELSGGNTFLIAIYTIMGFLGMLMIFWGLRK